MVSDAAHSGLIRVRYQHRLVGLLAFQQLLSGHGVPLLSHAVRKRLGRIVDQNVQHSAHLPNKISHLLNQLKGISGRSEVGPDYFETAFPDGKVTFVLISSNCVFRVPCRDYNRSTASQQPERSVEAQVDAPASNEGNFPAKLQVGWKGDCRPGDIEISAGLAHAREHLVGAAEVRLAHVAIAQGPAARCWSGGGVVAQHFPGSFCRKIRCGILYLGTIRVTMVIFKGYPDRGPSDGLLGFLHHVLVREFSHRSVGPWKQACRYVARALGRDPR
ncbi:hypothetical protein PG997_006430 [Apiospora hydei]|uniref:Uncharacterized protein n=1 Tax=Apiospora hydei TaxID=1337664 RepID=A0ABR1WRU5_9PEZI